MNRRFILTAISFLMLTGININAQNISLLPAPQYVKWGKTRFLPADAKIMVAPDIYQREKNNIDSFIAALKEKTGHSLTVTYHEESGINLIILNSEQHGPAVPLPNEKTGNGSRESYTINVTSGKVTLNAKSDAGLFYGLQTLIRMVVSDNTGVYIPEAEIEDFPSFAYRGVMMDFSHGGLLTVEEIKRQIDFLAQWKLNQYYFYNEVSIEMKGYPLINYNACYTQEQIKSIVAYGLEKHVDVIPFVAFYGHLHELLRVEKYAGLGIGKYGHDLDPRNPGVQTVLKSWIKQHADMFPSPFIHIGFDETWETERRTIEDPSIKPKDLWLSQLNFVSKTLKEYGKTVMVWTDISNNYPDVISGFPKDVIPVIWEYSDKSSSFEKWLKPVRGKMPFFIQSAVDNWGNVYTAADYTFDNIDLCLKTSRAEKAIGYITSVWTDAVQPLMRNAWLFMAYGSAGAWQKDPVDRNTFTENFCRIMYPEISENMAVAFRKMAESESFLAKCLGRHSMSEMWADPFSTYHLKNTRNHSDDYKNARLAADSAQENLIWALSRSTSDTDFIKSLLVNSRLLDFTASRFIWARTIVDRWNWIYGLNAGDKKDNNRFYDINYSTHGLMVDMMDWCTEIKREYSEAWLSEYMKYRMGTMTGRFDSEYQLWYNLYSKILDFRNRNNLNSSTLKFEEIFLNNR
jgi:hexosaminidase